MESFFAPIFFELKPETTMYMSLEWVQTVHVSGYDFVDSVGLCFVGNAVDNSVLFEQLEQN